MTLKNYESTVLHEDGRESRMMDLVKMKTNYNRLVALEMSTEAIWDLPKNHQT